MVAVGGLMLMGGGYFPHSMTQGLAATSVFVSAINIVGGFRVTQVFYFIYFILLSFYPFLFFFFFFFFF